MHPQVGFERLAVAVLEPAGALDHGPAMRWAVTGSTRPRHRERRRDEILADAPGVTILSTMFNAGGRLRPRAN
jgi:hypothetical protein